ncbi:hypothetical protein THRCLA_22461 [Thraustotheca clavata]|uniref:Transmembrane protein n=1 Tax=Thraustotheca clavata TaxID=74557 RepID=A0A1V9Z0A1_9STRA|nr:hypothetical protein THRCLA_22461 [Thraustotheca clavata]
MRSILLARVRLPPIAEETWEDEYFEQRAVALEKCSPFSATTAFEMIPDKTRCEFEYLRHSRDGFGMKAVHFIAMVFSVVCIEICKGVLVRATMLLTLLLVVFACHHFLVFHLEF